MILQEIYSNNLEILIPEFFLTLIILTFLLFGTFYKSSINNKNFLINITINKLIVFLLFITFILTLNIDNNIYLTLMNNTLFCDPLTQFTKSILIILTIICFISQVNYLKSQKIFFFEVQILLCLSLLGSILLTSSFHFLTLYLAIELQSLSFYILTASQRKSILSIEAAFKYFILSSIASGFILLGISILYGTMGSLNFNNIFLILNNIDTYNNIYFIFNIIYGLLFVLIGLLFKIGTAPFHFWLPDVYEGAPNNISAFFAIVPKISYISILIRLFFDIFSDISFFFENLFYMCAILSMLIGALATLQQKKIKRFLAYSSVSHVGFILIGFASNILENIPSILLYIFIYIIMSINLWITYLSLNINHKPIKYLTDLANFSKFNKIISFIIILNIFSMSGIPPLAGFFSKLFLFLSAIKAKYYGLVFFSIGISILSSFYYLRLIKVLFFEKINKSLFIQEFSKNNSYILIINTQIILLFFLFPNFLYINLNKIFLFFLI